MSGSLEAVEATGSSHVVMLSNPDAVVQMIQNAAQASVSAAAGA